MSDATTTLRALAAACDDCARFDRIIRSRSECASEQRNAMMCALPPGGWPYTAATLRTMADTVEALEAKCDKARALLTECAVEVEARGVDPSLAAAVREWLEVSDG